MKQLICSGRCRLHSARQRKSFLTLFSQGDSGSASSAKWYCLRSQTHARQVHMTYSNLFFAKRAGAVWWSFAARRGIEKVIYSKSDLGLLGALKSRQPNERDYSVRLVDTTVALYLGFGPYGLVLLFKPTTS